MLRATILIAALLSITIAFNLRHLQDSETSLEIGRYTSQSEQITEYLFEGTETKAYWV